MNYRIYYKLYRRRHLIFIAFSFSLLIYYLTISRSRSSSNNDQKQSNTDKKLNDLNNFAKNIPEWNSRISIETYKEPPPCRGCPGENGGGVTLNVLFLN